MKLTLKPTTQDDIDCILPMLYDLGKSDGVSSITTSGEHLLCHFYGKNPIAFARLICWEEQVMGFVIYSWKWATFTGLKEMYMQAIYIKPEYRQQGIASKAMGLLAQQAVKSGCSRIEWYAVKDKMMSHGFYDSLDSHILEHMVIRRISGRALIKLAERYSGEDSRDF